MEKKIEQIKASFLSDIQKVKSFQEFESLRVSYLGKKGQIQGLYQIVNPEAGSISNHAAYGGEVCAVRADRPGSGQARLQVGGLILVKDEGFVNVVTDHEGVPVGFVGRIQAHTVAPAPEDQRSSLLGRYSKRRPAA